MPRTQRLLITGLLLTLMGCEDPFIDPFVDGQHFTIWGYLSAFDEEHTIRVIPVRRFPEEINSPSDPQAEIDAEVTSMNLLTGKTVTWKHELVQLNDRTYGHVFRSSFLISPGGKYELSVTRSDGATSTAVATIPTGIEAEILPAEVRGDSVVQTIRWKDVPTAENIDVVYCAGPVGSRACSDGNDGGGLLIPYGASGTRNGNDWEVTVYLARDFRFLRDISRIPLETPLEVYTMQMRIRALDPTWTVFDDPEVFGQPGALHNVVNGFGYFGAIGFSTLDWLPDAEALAVLGVTPAPNDQ